MSDFSVFVDEETGASYVVKDKTARNLIGIGQFSEDVDYYAGDYCAYEDQAYKFTVDHPKGAWIGETTTDEEGTETAGDVEAVTIVSELVSLKEEADAGNQDVEAVLNGFESKYTEFGDDGTITETGDDGYKVVTEFQEDGSILETLYLNDVVVATKTTVFNDDGSITETVTKEESTT